MTVTHDRAHGRAVEDDGSAGRRIAMLALIGLGAFLVISALLLRFYAYPKLAIAPIDQDSVTTAEATDATILDLGTLAPITTDLTLRSTTVGDVEASEEAGGDIRVYTGATQVTDEDGEVRSQSAERTPMDGVTAEAVDCCDAFNETTDGERTPVVREGLVWKFPFDSQKKDYEVWDDTLGGTVTAEYAGTESVDGMSVYTYETNLTDTIVGERLVPRTLFDAAAVATSVPAEQHYETSSTYYVEPNTGVIIDREASVKEWLTSDAGEVITQEATFNYADEQVAANVDEYQTKATLLGFVNGAGLWILLVIGLVMLGIGVALKLRPAHD